MAKVDFIKYLEVMLRIQIVSKLTIRACSITTAKRWQDRVSATSLIVSMGRVYAVYAQAAAVVLTGSSDSESGSLINVVSFVVGFAPLDSSKA